MRYHMAQIMERLHLQNRAQVIAYAASHGLAWTTHDYRFCIPRTITFASARPRPSSCYSGNKLNYSSKTNMPQEDRHGNVSRRNFHENSGGGRRSGWVDRLCRKYARA